MNWDQVGGNWKQMIGLLREKWGKLTNDDFKLIAGKRERFIGKLQERYGMQKEEAEREMDAWLETVVWDETTARKHRAA